MDKLMLDGNAVAGLLQEVFAADMTTAIGSCATCRRDRAGRGELTSIGEPASSCAARTATTHSRRSS